MPFDANGKFVPAGGWLKPTKKKTQQELLNEMEFQSAIGNGGDTSQPIIDFNQLNQQFQQNQGVAPTATTPMQNGIPGAPKIASPFDIVNALGKYGVSNVMQQPMQQPQSIMQQPMPKIEQNWQPTNVGQPPGPQLRPYQDNRNFMEKTGDWFKSVFSPQGKIHQDIQAGAYEFGEGLAGPIPDLLLGPDAAQTQESIHQQNLQQISPEVAKGLNIAGTATGLVGGGEALAPFRALQGLNAMNRVKTVPGALKATQTLGRTGADRLITTAGNTALTGMGAEVIQGMTTPGMENRNTLEQMGAGLMAGSGDMNAGIGAGMNWLANKDNDLGNYARQMGFQSLADDLKATGENLQKGYSENYEFGWKSLINPNYYIYNVSKMLPFTAATLPLGFGGAAVADSLIAQTGMSAFGKNVLRSIGAGTAAAPFEAAVEAGQVYEESRKKGLSAEEADKAANKTFWGNVGLLSLTNAGEFATAFMPKGIARGFDNPGVRLGLGAVTEGGQEMGQEAISRNAKGEPIRMDANMLEQGLLGGIMGLGFGALGSVSNHEDTIRSIQNRTVDKLDQETKTDIQEGIEEARAQGISEEDAMREMMDALADSPDAKHQQAIHDATQEEFQSKALDKINSDPAFVDNFVKQLSAQQLMDQERYAQPQPVYDEFTGQEREARRQVDPMGTLIGFNPLGQAPQAPDVVTRPDNAAERPQGPREAFTAGEFVRVPGKAGVFQVFEDRAGKKQKIVGPDGQVSSVHPQSMVRFADFKKGDAVTLPDRPGSFRVEDMRDGKRVRVIDGAGNAFHYDKAELTPAISGNVAPAQQPDVPVSGQAAPEQETVSQTVNVPRETIFGNSEAKPGDTITLRGKGEQKFTVVGHGAKDMLKLKSEQGGELTVHKKAVSGIISDGAAPATATTGFNTGDSVSYTNVNGETVSGKIREIVGMPVKGKKRVVAPHAYVMHGETMRDGGEYVPVSDLQAVPDAKAVSGIISDGAAPAAQEQPTNGQRPKGIPPEDLKKIKVGDAITFAKPNGFDKKGAATGWDYFSGTVKTITNTHGLPHPYVEVEDENGNKTERLVSYTDIEKWEPKQDQAAAETPEKKDIPKEVAATNAKIKADLGVDSLLTETIEDYKALIANYKIGDRITFAHAVEYDAKGNAKKYGVAEAVLYGYKQRDWENGEMSIVGMYRDPQLGDKWHPYLNVQGGWGNTFERVLSVEKTDAFNVLKYGEVVKHAGQEWRVQLQYGDTVLLWRPSGKKSGSGNENAIVSLTDDLKLDAPQTATAEPTREQEQPQEHKPTDAQIETSDKLHYQEIPEYAKYRTNNTFFNKTTGDMLIHFVEEGKDVNIRPHPQVYIRPDGSLANDPMSDKGEFYVHLLDLPSLRRGKAAPAEQPADEPTKTKPKYKTGDYVIHNGKVKWVDSVTNKGYPTEIAMLKDPERDVLVSDQTGEIVFTREIAGKAEAPKTEPGSVVESINAAKDELPAKQFKMLAFAVGPKPDEMEVIRRAKPDTILVSYQRWMPAKKAPKSGPRKATLRQFLESLNYKPNVILDSGALGFYNEGKYVGPDGMKGMYGDNWQEIFDMYHEQYEEEGMSPAQLIANIRQDMYALDTDGMDGFTPAGQDMEDFLGYIEFIQNHRDVVSHFMNMDTIGNEELTTFAMEVMTEMGAKPIPVFGYGMDMKVLDRWIEEDHDYIALGGTAIQQADGKKLTQAQRIEWVKGILEAHPDTKFHLLGTNDQKVLNALPGLYSADGTTWITAAGAKTIGQGQDARIDQATQEIHDREQKALGKAPKATYYGGLATLNGDIVEVSDVGEIIRFNLNEWPVGKSKYGYYMSDEQNKFFHKKAQEQSVEVTRGMSGALEKLMIKMGIQDRVGPEAATPGDELTPDQAKAQYEEMHQRMIGKNWKPQTTRKHLEAMKQFAETHGIEFNPYLQDRLDKFNAAAAEEEAKQKAADDRKAKFEQEQQQANAEYDAKEARFREIAKGYPHVDAFLKGVEYGDRFVMIDGEKFEPFGRINGPGYMRQAFRNAREEMAQAEGRETYFMPGDKGMYYLGGEGDEVEIVTADKDGDVTIRFPSGKEMVAAGERIERLSAAAQPDDQVSELQTEIANLEAELQSRIDGLVADMKAGAGEMNAEDIRKRIMKRGGIAPYKDGHLKDEYKQIPLSLRNGKGLTLDVLADELGMTERELLDAVTGKARPQANFENRAKVELQKDPEYKALLQTYNDLVAELEKLQGKAEPAANTSTPEETVETSRNGVTITRNWTGTPRTFTIERGGYAAVLIGKDYQLGKVVGISQANKKIRVDTGNGPAWVGNDYVYPVDMAIPEKARKAIRDWNEQENWNDQWSLRNVYTWEKGPAPAIYITMVDMASQNKAERFHKHGYVGFTWFGDNPHVSNLKLKTEGKVDLGPASLFLEKNTKAAAPEAPATTTNEPETANAVDDYSYGFGQEADPQLASAIEALNTDDPKANYIFVKLDMSDGTTMYAAAMDEDKRTPEGWKEILRLDHTVVRGATGEMAKLIQPVEQKAAAPKAEKPARAKKPTTVDEVKQGLDDGLIFDTPHATIIKTGENRYRMTNKDPKAMAKEVEQSFTALRNVIQFALERKTGRFITADSQVTQQKIADSQETQPAKAPRTLTPLPEDPAQVKPEQFAAHVTAMRSLIDEFKTRIMNNSLQSAKRENIRKIASEVLGRPATEDEWSDTLEAAAQEVAIEATRGVYTDRIDFAKAKDLVDIGQTLEGQITTANRSLEKRERQQYSTPIPLAAIANYVTDVGQADIVKEGSAGTGSLILPMAEFMNKKADIRAVELSPRRAAILTAMGFEVINQDTFQTTGIEADVVIGNPPFQGENRGRGTVAFAGNPPWKGGWGDLGNRFLTWDLRSLPEGGRLVYVTSPGVIDGKQNAEFRKWLRENHTVRAMVKIHEGGYESRGTSFGAGLIVVDKGKLSNAAEAITGTAEDWTGLLDMLKPLAGGGTHARLVQSTDTQRAGGSSDRSASSGSGVRTAADSERSNQTDTSGRGNDRRRDGDTEAGSAGESGRSGRPVNEAGNDTRPAADGRERPSDLAQGQQAEVRGDVLPNAENAGRDDANRSAGTKRDRSRPSPGEDVPGFVDYVPRVKQTGQKHRGEVVEPSNLAMVMYPDEVTTDPLFQPHPNVTKGGTKTISDIQAEAVMLSKYNWHNGKRGMLIADDTGMGKTAEQMAIAADAWYSSRANRILIVTYKDQIAQDDFVVANKEFGFNMPLTFVNSDTHKNFKDDHLLDLAKTKEKLERSTSKRREALREKAKKAPYQPLEVGDGAIVMSYYTFSDATHAVQEWLNGGNKDVLVMFDESHTLKNVDDAQVAKAATELYRSFKDKGQFVYSSATAAEDISGMEHLFGLGLWGTNEFGAFRMRLQGSESSAGKKKETGLARSLNKQSPFQREVPLTMMEQIVRELKRNGQYVGRALSMDGIEMDAIPIKLSAEDIGDWNRAVDFIVRIANKAEEHGKKPTERGRIMGGVVGYMRRLRSYYVMKGIIAHMQEQQASGRLERFALSGFYKGADEEGENKNLSAAIRSINQTAEGEDNFGESVSVDIAEAVEDKETLLAMLRGEHAEYDFRSPVPELPSPIKMLYDAFGEDAIGVVSGDINTKERSANVKEFVTGKKPIIFFTEAGNTGISLHDTIGKKIGFYHVDYPYEAKKAKQSEGRVNRTGQTTKPVFFYPYTESSVDTKFVGTLLARYQAMGALSRGKSSSIGGDALGSFDLTGPIVEIAADRVVHELDPDIRAKMFGNWTRDMGENSETELQSVYGSGNADKVKKFLNALMLLPFNEGNQVFEQFMGVVEDVKQRISEAGGMTDKFDVYNGKELSATVGNGGLVLRKIHTELTDDQRASLENTVQQATAGLQEAEQTLDEARAGAIQALREKIAKDKEKQAELRPKYQEIRAKREQALRDRTMKQPELDKIVKRYTSIGAELGGVNTRILQNGDLLERATHSNATVSEKALTEMPSVRRAQDKVNSMRNRLLNADAILTSNGTVMLVDGQILTTGLMVPIRTAIRKAAIKHYNTQNPPDSALRVELRGYYLEDGTKVVGAVVPGWAEGEVAQALNARLAYAGEAADMSGLLEHIQNGNVVELENGFTLRYLTRLKQVVIQGMTAARHRELFYQLNGGQGNADTDIGFMANSQAFVIRNEAGLKKLTDRFPVKDLGNASGSLRDIQEQNADRINRDKASDNMGIVPEFMRTRGKPKKASPHAYSDPDLEAIHQAAVIPKETWIERSRKFLSEFKKRATREFIHLPKTAQFEPLRQRLLQLGHQRGVAGDTVNRDLLQSIVLKLDKNRYDLFVRKVMLDDFQEEADMGNALPNGFTPETLTEQKAIIDDKVNADPFVRDAIKQRNVIWKAIKNDYIKAMDAIGEDVSERFQREYYFRHQVIAHYGAEDYNIGDSPSKLRTPNKRGFLRGRSGEFTGIINRDYLQADFEVMTQMIYDIDKAKVIKMVDDKYNVRGELNKEAKAANKAELQKIIDAEIASRKHMKYRRSRPSELPDQQEVLQNVKETPQPYSPTEETLKEFQVKQAVAYSQFGKMDPHTLWAGDNDEYADVVQYLTSGKVKVDKDLMYTIDPDFDRANVMKYFADLAQRDGEPGVIQARTILKAIGEKNSFIQQTLGDNFKTWRDMMPDGYTEWQPDPGNHFYIASTVDLDKLAQDFATGVLDDIGGVAEMKAYVREQLVLGSKKREYAIPVEVADTLEAIMKQENRGFVYQTAAGVMRIIKAQLLIGPTRVVKYNFRNLTSDAEKTFAGNPKAFRFAFRAMKEVGAVIYRETPMTPEMREWFQRGGMQTLLQVQEMGNINELKMFVRLAEKSSANPVKLWTRYWQAARRFTDFREAVLRYANYLEYLGQIQKNGKPANYGSSRPDLVDALEDPRDKAFKLSNELLVDYSSTSNIGTELSTAWFPFFRWIEGNMKSTLQLFKNAARDEKLAGAVGRKLLGKAVVRSPYFAYRAGSLAIKVSFLAVLLQVYNNLVWGDEEDELPEDVKKKLHIVFGRDSSGKVRYLDRLGAMEDFLEWFGMDNAISDVRDILDNRKTLGEVARENFGKQQVNKLVNSWNPLNKYVGESIRGSKSYPDAFNEGRITDPYEHLAQFFGFNKEYNALVDHFKDQPGPAYNPLDMLTSGADAGQSAYYDILARKREYIKRAGKSTGQAGELSPKSQALYQYKMALRYGDKEAEKRYLRDYAAAGGTVQGLKQSLAYLDPLHGLSRVDEAKFYQSLNADDRAKLKRAQQFYKETLLGRTPMK